MIFKENFSPRLRKSFSTIQTYGRVYGDPPILTSPHPRIYTHSYTAHFSTFSAQSVAHLCCAHLGAVITYVNSGINKDAMLCCF